MEEKKEVELNKIKDDNKEKFLREPNDNEEGILQFENLNFKLAVIQVLMYDLNLLKPCFDIYDFADDHKELEIDTDSYTVIEPALNFFYKIVYSNGICTVCRKNLHGWWE